MYSNSIQDNLRTWDQEHGWPEDGDEWKGQAVKCGVPYEDWKQSLVETLIVPHVPARSTVVEIAPGHGRWTGFFAERAQRLILVDLSPSCLDHCRRRFSSFDNIRYFRTDGASLPDDLTEEVDLVWSFDAFVHMEADVIGAYLKEAKRVLKPGGMVLIHHGNRRRATLWLSFLRRLGPAGQRIYRMISLGTDEVDDGWRSDVSASDVVRLAEAAGLSVEKQFCRWGEGDRYGVPRYRDRVTILRKASS